MGKRKRGRCRCVVAMPWLRPAPSDLGVVRARRVWMIFFLGRASESALATLVAPCRTP